MAEMKLGKRTNSHALLFGHCWIGYPLVSRSFDLHGTFGNVKRYLVVTTERQVLLALADRGQGHHSISYMHRTNSHDKELSGLKCRSVEVKSLLWIIGYLFSCCSGVLEVNKSCFKLCVLK